MLSRCLHISRCSVLYNSTHSSFRPSPSVWHIPFQWNPLRPPLWLSAVPLLWSLAFCRVNNTITNYTGGSLGSWLLSGWLKRKRIAKVANREHDGDPPTTATVQVPTLKRRYRAIQGTCGEAYRTPSLVRGPLVHSEVHTVDGIRAQPLGSPRNHAFTCRPVGTAFLSTIATVLRMGVRNHGRANHLVSAPRRTMVSIGKVGQNVRGKWWRNQNPRLWFVGRRSRKSVGGKAEKGSAMISERFDHSPSRQSTALAQIRSNQKLWSSEVSSGPTSLLVEHNRGLMDNEDSLEFWIASTRRHKLRTWESKLIFVLRESPPDVLKILRANLQSSGIFLPRRIVEGCLDHLACLYLNTSTCTSSAYFDLIYSIAGDYLETYGQIFDSVSLSQRTIRLLSRHCDADQLILFLEKLNKNTAFIHTNTKLHIMPKLVTYGKVGLALSLLKQMPAKDLLLDKVQMFCVMLLRANLEVHNLYRLRSNLLAFMLEAGVRPNRFLANIIILNASEAGDLSTAWRSHDIAKENGLVPDAATYTALLKGVHHQNAKLTVRLVHRDAKLDGWLFKSSRLKFELLYAFYISNSGKYHDQPYSNLLPYYRQFFDVKPLQELGIFHSTADCIEEKGQFPEPTVPALGLILLAWLTENHDSGPVLAVYERYLYYTRNNHPLIAQLAETDYTANAFIVAFGQSPRTVHICTQVVQDMLKLQVIRIDASQSFPSISDASHFNKSSIENVIEDSSREERSNEDLENYEIRRIAPPTVQTWSILLFAFIKHRQSDAAEKVLSLMKARGQKPNIVTWNSLLSGYASMQDFPGMVSTLKRMDQACLEDDEWTAKALARVVDRDSLLRNFEESTQEDIDDTNGKQAMASF